MPRRGNPKPRGLRAVLVRDAMTTPIVTCTPDVPIEEVAELMAHNRIHSVVVLQPGGEDAAPAHRRWGVLSDLDLVSAAPWGEDASAEAGAVAASPQVVVRADDTLSAAALLMSEYATAHVLVIEEGADEPVGILSALDVARALAGERPAREPRRSGGGAAVTPGDRLVVAPHRQGEPPRDAEVLEVRGADGGPPYLVRWEDTGRVSLHYPGGDSVVQHITGALS